jgi:hypothetical protein
VKLVIRCAIAAKDDHPRIENFICRGFGARSCDADFTSLQMPSDFVP